MWRACYAILLISPLTPCLAQGGGGAVPVRVPVTDGAGNRRCINAGADKVWFTLRRVVTTKTKGWFTQDNTVAGIINASVKADPQPAKQIVFPLMTEATLRDYSVGQVSVPIEYTIVSGLNLAQSGVTYTGIGVDVTLLNKRGRNRWGNALAALNEITKKLPIPASPITQSASYLMDFANSAVEKDITGQEVDDKVKSAALALNFDPTGNCAGPGPDGSDFETTGTIAVVQDDGVRGSDYIDIRHSNEYCWSADLRPAFVLKAARKDGSIPCTDDRYASRYRQVTNNYVGFFLNAVQATRVSGGGTSRDTEQSVARCLANGISRSECLK